MLYHTTGDGAALGGLLLRTARMYRALLQQAEWCSCEVPPEAAVNTLPELLTWMDDLVAGVRTGVGAEGRGACFSETYTSSHLDLLPPYHA